MPNHIILLGDSIFDNSPYVPEHETVSDQLAAILPNGCRATLLANDGAVVYSVAEHQIKQIPRDATHVVLSIGGNNALGVSSLLGMKVDSVRDALAILSKPLLDFSQEYACLLGKLRDLQLPLIVCTVYDAVPGLQVAEKLGLSLFNDVITRNIIAGGDIMMDLREICTEADDYSEVSPIEPSSVGGAKIAREILARII
jgi:hypothetical protein